MKLKNGLLPEFNSNIEYLIEAVALGKKPEEYIDESTMLIAVLLELTVIFKSEVMYNEIQKYLSKGMSFQIPSIDHGAYKVEELLFDRNLNKEYHIEMLDNLDSDFNDFIKRYNEVSITSISYRSDKAGYSFLRYLAHSYYKNELLPEEWRINL